MINPRLLTTRTRHKTCPFINNVESASTNVIHFITWSYLKLGERFLEHHCDVGMTNTHLKQSSDTLIIASYIASKLKENKLSFKLALLTPPPPPPPPFIVFQCWESRLIFQRLAKNDKKICSGFHEGKKG